MYCPACRSDLSDVEAPMPDGSVVGFHSCPSCLGLWIAEFEIKKVLKLRAFPEDYIPTNAPSEGLFLIEEGRRVCPECFQVLDLVERNGIKVDVCKGCKAVWFDGGELYQLYTASAGALQQPKRKILYGNGIESEPAFNTSAPSTPNLPLTPSRAPLCNNDQWGSLERPETTVYYDRRGRMHEDSGMFGFLAVSFVELLASAIFDLFTDR